jgi:transcription initiation factor TFIID subunit 2
MADVDLQQPDFMWADQLHRDKDVIVQYEAFKALELAPSKNSSGNFLACVY